MHSKHHCPGGWCYPNLWITGRSDPTVPTCPSAFTARSEDGGIAQSRYYACNDRTGEAAGEEQMAKGQKRSTREKKKPKANKKIMVPA